ncbi:phosphatidate cytidylyltransferase [candidate division KSB1 bacterium]|nr:phosphatidate cytidylyltransferase [candidate division KSB1 bacterium]
MKFKQLGVRVLVAVVGIPAILFLVLWGREPFALLIATIICLSQFELYQMTESKHVSPKKIVGLLIGIILPATFYYKGVKLFWVVLLAGIIVILLIELFRNRKEPLLNAATTIFGLIYPASLFSFMILIRELPRELNQDYPRGAHWILAMLVSVWICDTAAYFIGSWIGRHKLFERVSPNKTVEGAVAGFIFALLTGYLIHLILFKDTSLVHLMVIAAIGGSIGQLGDLVESLFKRDVGIKDSSSILPGHGGILDRFDSLFLAAPVVYVYLWIVFVY